MTVWFTSDTHFNHKNIIRYCGRPFEDVQSMNDSIVERWNSCVKPTDKVYHLGDIGLFSQEEDVNAMVDNLNGTVWAVKGNHDGKKVKRALGYRLQKARGYWIDHTFAVMVHKPCNFPAIVQTNDWNNVVLLYGHVHDRAPDCLHWVRFPDGKEILAYHVGVDTNNFFPVSEDAIAHMVRCKDKDGLPVVRVGDPERF